MNKHVLLWATAIVGALCGIASLVVVVCRLPGDNGHVDSTESRPDRAESASPGAPNSRGVDRIEAPPAEAADEGPGEVPEETMPGGTEASEEEEYDPYERIESLMENAPPDDHCVTDSVYNEETARKDTLKYMKRIIDATGRLDPDELEACVLVTLKHFRNRHYYQIMWNKNVVGPESATYFRKLRREISGWKHDIISVLKWEKDGGSSKTGIRKDPTRSTKSRWMKTDGFLES